MRPIFLSLLWIYSLFAAEAVQWSENVTGVTTGFKTDKKEIALTFDACGGSPKSSQVDEKLLQFLISHQIPATLFINARWIDSNPEVFKKLASNPLFEIANHGTLHKPLSTQGKSVYGISGTGSPEEVIFEIEGNNKKIEKLTGKRPHFFRSGTAYYDEKAVTIARDLGMEIGGYSVLGDAGATFSAHKVTLQLSSVKGGDIVLLHMNHPESGTREGVADAILYLENQGFSFVRLSDVKKDLIRVP
jgi:peptidoglycan/xylan/chitin deacetylase (PgdA/CDA1 family)